MMNKIPSAWVTRPFGDLNKFYGPNIDPASYPSEKFELYSIPVFPTGKPEQPLGSDIGSTKQMVEHNDVLISKINPRINRVWQVGPSIGLRQIASSEWIGFRCSQMDARFFRYYFTSPVFRDLLCSDVTGVGGSLTRAQPKRVASFLVPVAPAKEQKRIADKLDTVLTRVDAVNTRLARVAPLLKRFRQSVLAAATSGRLTEDWRAETSTSDDWVGVTEPLKEIVSLDLGFAFKSADFVTDGVRLLRGDNIEPGALRWRNAKCLPTESIDSSRHIQLEAGDVVLAMDRPLISNGLKVARVSSNDLPCLLVQRVCRFRPTSKLDPGYLYAALQSQTFVNHLSSVQNGSSIPHISGGQILSFELPLPTVEEQAEIVRRVETLFAFADRLEARLQAAQTAADRLTPSLLAKAFRGELVPQDPNDEPASELLKRLAGSTPAGVTKRGRARAAKAE